MSRQNLLMTKFFKVVKTKADYDELKKDITILTAVKQQTKCNLDKFEVMHMGNKQFQLYIFNDGFLADYYHMEMRK